MFEDGNVKAGQSNPRLIQNTHIWFTACTPHNLIDDPLNGSSKFEICHTKTSPNFKNNVTHKLVYDSVDDFFKIIIADEQQRNVCKQMSCLLHPITVLVIGTDESNTLIKHVVIERILPSSRHIMLVDRARTHFVYGKVNLSAQHMDKTSDIYGVHCNKLFKLQPHH